MQRWRTRPSDCWATPLRWCAAPRCGRWVGSIGIVSVGSPRCTGQTRLIRQWSKSGLPCYRTDMNAKLKNILQRVEAWPQPAQDELMEIALEIEAQLGGTYEATPEELEAIDRGLRDAAEGR